MFRSLPDVPPSPAHVAVRLYDDTHRVILRTEMDNPFSDAAVLPDVGTLSFWVRSLSGGRLYFGTDQSSSDRRGSSVEVSDGGMVWRASDVGGNLVNAVSVYTGVAAGQWGHVMIAWNNLSSPRTARMCRDNALVGSESSFNSNVYFKRGYFNINGFRNESVGESRVELYDFWLLNATLDLSDAAVRAKFIHPTTLKPVFLGADGTAPGYGQPRVFYSGSLATWRQNKGSLALPELQIIGNNTAFGQALTTPN